MGRHHAPTEGEQPTVIFGREPATILAALQTVVGLLVVLGVLKWSAEQTSLIMAAAAAVLGVIVAAFTRDTMLGYVIGAVNAIAAVIVGFGFALNPEAAAGIISLITVVSGYFQRTQTSPLATPTLAL